MRFDADMGMLRSPDAAQRHKRVYARLRRAMALREAVRCRAGVVTNAGAWYGPGSAEQREERCTASGKQERSTMFEKNLLANKRILVTGGGSGLGAAMARRFVELGADLIICGRRLELLEQTAAQLRTDPGGNVRAIRCDIRDGAAVDAMMDDIWREAPLDVLVNNAAATFIAQTEHLSFRAADAILAPTLHGAMYCTLAAGKRWIEGQHKGVVLSILSTSTITGRAFTVPSAMAKSAVLAMTKSLAVEWGPKGIRTVAIAPGPFPTAGATGQLRPEGRDEGPAARNPLGRVGEHGELANLASFLISDQADYINGEMVVQDGGAHLRGSGAEDLLQWTDAQWEKQRAARKG
jgi:NAD(P)-dependent dehydrogenase (short-subunit alcohol dehydrogenase family)